MGTYVNPGTRNMEIDIDDEFYVDKSMIISLLNDKVERVMTGSYVSPVHAVSVRPWQQT